jgi:cytochrome c oxidase cbb3-type subunit IV
MDMTVFHSYWTLLLFLLFIGIIIWAWSSKRKSRFDELANLPLEEEKFAEKTTKSEGKDNA